LTLLPSTPQSEIHRRVTIHPFTRRKPLTKAELSRIQAPIVVVHSGEDSVTPLEGSEGLVREMREAGVGGARGVHLKVIPRAAHVRPTAPPKPVAGVRLLLGHSLNFWLILTQVANQTHAREINALLSDFLLASLPQGSPVPPAPIGLGAQQSPFYADLYRDQPTDEDDDDY
jgi:hypothetical protein